MIELVVQIWQQSHQTIIAPAIVGVTSVFAQAILYMRQEHTQVLYRHCVRHVPRQLVVVRREPRALPEQHGAVISNARFAHGRTVSKKGLHTILRYHITAVIRSCFFG